MFGPIISNKFFFLKNFSFPLMFHRNKLVCLSFTIKIKTVKHFFSIWYWWFIRLREWVCPSSLSSKILNNFISLSLMIHKNKLVCWSFIIRIIITKLFPFPMVVHKNKLGCLSFTISIKTIKPFFSLPLMVHRNKLVCLSYTIRIKTIKPF